MQATPGPSKRQRVLANPLLGPVFLPSSVLRSIFEYCDFANLVKLASCNATLGGFIYDQVQFWRIVDFAAIRKECSNRITDEELDVFLRRIHARENCESLRLSGCLRIRGSGLESLRSSNSLKEIDLRLIHPCDDDQQDHVEVDLDLVLPILSSIAPFPGEDPAPDDKMPSNDGQALGLMFVRFHQENLSGANVFARHSPRIADWLREYVRTLIDRVVELGIPCDHCQRTLSDRFSRDELKWVVPGNFCDQCYKCSCGECSDGQIVSFCDLCSRQCCQHFGKGPRTCPGTINREKECIILPCENDECRRQYCFDCDGGRTCWKCENARYYCSDCYPDHGYVCTQCQVYYCDDCDNGKSCRDCLAYYCSECFPDGGVDCAEECGTFQCGSCEDGMYSYCEGFGCDKYFCSDCLVGGLKTYHTCSDEIYCCSECLEAALDDGRLPNEDPNRIDWNDVF